MKLTTEEQQLSKQELVFKWLEEEKISFTDLTLMYTYYLENKDKQNSVLINGLAIPLLQYWRGSVPKGQKKFITGKACYNLLKSKVFATADIEKILQRDLDESGYSEDEGVIYD